MILNICFVDSGLINRVKTSELKIIVTTVYTASTLYTMDFEKGEFSHIFIDEAGQTMEPEILFPLCLYIYLLFKNNT